MGELSEKLFPAKKDDKIAECEEATAIALERNFLDLLADIGTGDGKYLKGKLPEEDFSSTLKNLRSPNERKKILKDKEQRQKAASYLFLILKEKFVEEKNRGLSALFSFMEKYLEKSILAAEISGDLTNKIEILELKRLDLLQQEELLEAEKIKKRILLLKQLKQESSAK